jgi:hypothetical protein
VEVVINAKAENLGDVIEAPGEGMVEEAIQGKLKEISRRKSVVLDGSNSSLDLLNRLVAAWQVEPKEVTVFAGGKWGSSARKRAAHYGYAVTEEKPSVELGVVDGVLVRSLPGLQTDHSMVISEAAFDPVYGVRGSASALAEALGLGPEAVRRWKGNPSPAAETDPGWFAGRLTEEVGDPFCLEYVRSKKGLAALFVGPCAEVRRRSTETLNQTRVFSAPRSRLLVVSPGGADADSTLHSSLAALCDQAAVVGEEAEAILVAEAGEGLGSQALRTMCDMNVRPDSLSHLSGYEDILMLKWLKSKLKLHVVSTLPRTIVERRLGLLAPASVKNAFEDIEARHGWKLKATVVKDASLTLLRIP